MTQSAVFLKSMDSNEAQARLDALAGSFDNSFDSMFWQFKGQNGEIIIIDFNDLEGIIDRYPNWLLAYSNNLVLLTKWMCLSSELMMTTNTIKYYISGLKLFWTALAEHDFTQLTRTNCRQVVTFLLMHGWRQGKAAKNWFIKSYGNFYQQVNLKVWKIAFFYHDLDLIARDVTDSYLNKELKELIPKLTDTELTYRDWYEGGSYNMMTLDYGRYYVEHCLTFFEKHYSLAMALASTYRAVPELAKLSGYKQSTVNQVAAKVLQGYSDVSLLRQLYTTGVTTIQNISESVSYYFESAYREAQLESELLKDETLEIFVTACGLDVSPENTDRMRVIMWDWVRRKDKAETQSLLSEYQNVPWGVFEKQLDVFRRYYDQQPCKIPTPEEFQAIGLVKGELSDAMSSHSRQLVHLVSKAGLTAMVALTGWRRSELGFPVSAVKRTRNTDKLDQYAFPYRYQVDWYVSKTHGKIRQLREITFGSVLIAERVQSLIGATDEQPCLYSVTKKNKNPFNPGASFERGVRAMWGHFVHHYEGFKLIDDWLAWEALQEVSSTGKAFTQVEQQEFERLLTQRPAEEWTHLLIDTNLKESWRRAREELPRTEIFLSSSTTVGKKDILIRYRDGMLRPDWKAVFEEHLSSSIKDWIHSLSEDELKDNYASKVVMNSLLEGTLYPGPHAFRHMWAEAVYRRFDGDAGWMIRSQFKHVSRDMWLAYIRDKDNRIGHEQAKVQVISSLVRNYLRNEGKGYAGQMHVWLRRLFNKTSVLMPEELEQLAERIAAVEIENIKTSPWGYCLLKRRTKNNAKCAEMGEPMRHNASPELCLGCVHNLMQTENVEWTLFHVAPHVEALKNPMVPVIYKESSYRLVKNVTRHTRTLDPQHEALAELEVVLAEYEASRAV